MRRKQKSFVLEAITLAIVVVLTVAVFVRIRPWLVGLVPIPATSHTTSRGPVQRPEIAPPGSSRGSSPSPAAPRADPSAPAPRPAASGLAPRPSASPALPRSVHVALGVPTDADPSDDVLLDEGVYVLSYNPNRRVANWVSWHLSGADLGHIGRTTAFHPERSLPSGLYQVTARDYARSGYDRGHLCPSADREDSPESNARTFLMVNVQPQLHELNAGPWEKLEQYERWLASRPGAELYLVAGGLFDEPSPTIGHGVAVPRASYKIIVVLRKGQRAADVSESSEILAVEMPNREGVGARPWTEFVTSVAALERESGYDFLSDVPASVQRVVESRVGAPPVMRF